ncbi:MAG: DeoR family transcriptional regulator [Enterocloster sp.]
MKREKVYVDERRKRILEILRDRSQVQVDDLAELLNISVITVRRDLQYLEEQKRLIRVYGGAVAVQEQAEQTDEIQLYRDLIARYAASLVEDGDTLFLNTSRNVRQILRYITKKM